MNIRYLTAGAVLLLASAAQAAPPEKAVLLDYSSGALIDAPSARAVLAEGIPRRVWQVYPANKWAFVSQVEGGVTPAGMCVVTARVMLVPLTQTLKAVLLRPEKIATTFDAAAGSGTDQCRQLARTKLIEATQSVVSSLVKS